MMPPGPPALTNEERELALRIARLDARAEPAPALDARILAQARAAAMSGAAARRSPWPVRLGLVASLVLAFGLAWQLRPSPEQHSPPRLESHSAPPMASASAPASTRPEYGRRPGTSGLPIAADAITPEKATAPAQRPRHVSPPITAVPDAPPVVFDQPVPQDVAAAPMHALPAPAPPPPPVDTIRAAVQSAPGSVPATVSQEKTEATDTSGTQSAPNEAHRAAEAQDTADPASHADEPLDDIPPATADSPAVREAWLQRIRDLADDGDIAGARASLREFVRRYPGAPLPEDLRALER